MRKPDMDEVDFSRRHLMLGVGQFALFALLFGRLQYLQIAQSDTYRTLADANRINVRPVAPPRGHILDRHSIVLAENDHNLQVEITPEQVPNMSQTIAYLGQILDLSDGQQRALLRRIARLPAFKTITVAENLSWARFAELNLQRPFLAGVAPRVGDKRVYHYNQAAAHLVGYVGAKTSRDVVQFGNSPASAVGQSGIERAYETTLRGAAGVRQLEVNAYGRTVRELTSDMGQAGTDLRLTIDMRLQEYIAKRLRRHSGAVVVMDVNNGEVLALVSAPSFDPNQLSHGIDIASWDKMLAHEKKPLINKAISGLYAPGSAFKMIVAMAALEAGVITPDEEVACSGIFAFANEEFHCWKEEGHGSLALEAALEQSCDSYFYEIALRTGINNIERMARRFGLGQATGIDVLGEKAGTVPGRDWKRANYGASWRSGETVITGIGQGFLLATPLQLAVMTAMFANGGRRITPFAVWRGARPAPASDASSDPPFDLEHLRLIKRALYRVVNRPDGTAYASSLLIDGARMSGKTGTVQVRRISKAERETGVLANEELDWHLRDHALFVGYVPHDAPRYAIAVTIEHGGAGAQIAAPIARDVMVHLLSLKPAPQPLAGGNRRGGAS